MQGSNDGGGADGDASTSPWGYMFVATLLGAATVYVLAGTGYNMRTNG